MVDYYRRRFGRQSQRINIQPFEIYNDNSIQMSNDGLEQRVIAKDLLYKFANTLKLKNTFNIKQRLNNENYKYIRWDFKKKFKAFMEHNI